MFHNHYLTHVLKHFLELNLDLHGKKIARTNQHPHALRITYKYIYSQSATITKTYKPINMKINQQMYIFMYYLILVSEHEIFATTDHLPSEKELMSMFERWMTTYNRVYSSPEEKAKRFEIFKETVASVNAHNSTPGIKYKQSVNMFADLNREEFMARFTGSRKYFPQPSTESVAPRLDEGIVGASN